MDFFGEVDYLLREFQGKPVCLVSSEMLSARKDFNITHHYNPLHKAKYEKSIKVAST